MEQSDTKKSPFKFLDAFEKGDSEYFFGRDSEVGQLYDFVNKNRIVLVYGQSGTGKTSLIQCGLANEFDPTDWVPFFLRRGENLNESLLRLIEHDTPAPSDQQLESLEETLFTNMDGLDMRYYTAYDRKFIARVVYNLQKVTERYLRTVYLIFDQFEELLILGTENEKELFIKVLKVLLSPDTMVGCHIIIVMREEYFAWLDTFEKDIPTLSDRRLRIEPMRTPEIATVIHKSCKKFNITLANPEENVQQIIDALSKRGADVSLPYLQVYLDQLWRIDYKRTYPSPEGYTGPEKFPPLVLTTEEITEFGEIKDVMQRFLIEQKRIFQHKITTTFPDVSTTFIDLILDSFVNDQGTKIPNAYIVEDGYYKFKRRSSKILQETNPDILKFTLDFLQSSQIIRNVGNSFELGHDILARLIDKQRDAKQQRLNGIRVMISLHRKSQETIPYDLVKRWDRSIEELNLGKDELLFYDNSKNIGQKEEEENSRLRHLEELRRKRRNERTSWILLSGLLLISVLLYSYWQSLKVLDTYYAVDTLPKLDSVSNKQDALIMADYLSQFTGSDSVKRNMVRKKMMEIAQTQSFASILSDYDSTLNSSATLVNHLDIDISGNGNYIAVKNDFSPSETGVVSLINLTAKKDEISFKNVKYAYFLNHSDTLLLALAISKVDSLSILSFLQNYPDKFILYDCKMKKSDTLYLNDKKSMRNFLFDKERLHRNHYSDWDSYFVRKINPDKLVIPYFNIDNEESFNSAYKIYFGNKANHKVLSNSSMFTVSTSRQSDKILYAEENAEKRVFKVVGDDFREMVLTTNARYADFTTNGNVVYANNNKLVISNENNTVLKQLTIDSNIMKVYSGEDENIIFIEDDGNNLILADLKKQKEIFRIKETFIGANYKSKVFVTQKIVMLKNYTDSTYLVLRNFQGKTLKKIAVNPGIESLEYNIATGNLLVKSNQISPGNLQLLYLWDSNLTLKGSFYLTPNDSYGFSNNGKSFFYVRDKDLSVFANTNKLWDVSSFTSINKMIVQLKQLNEKNYQSHLEKILEKHQIPKSPSQKFRL